jgi:hypothetical protein
MSVGDKNKGRKINQDPVSIIQVHFLEMGGQNVHSLVVAISVPVFSLPHTQPHLLCTPSFLVLE